MKSQVPCILQEKVPESNFLLLPAKAFMDLYHYSQLIRKSIHPHPPKKNHRLRSPIPSDLLVQVFILCVICIFSHSFGHRYRNLDLYHTQGRSVSTPRQLSRNSQFQVYNESLQVMSTHKYIIYLSLLLLITENTEINSKTIYQKCQYER